MRIDSLRTLRVSLAGTATSKFTDVLEAVFGVDEEMAPELEKEEPDEAEEDLPAEGVVEKGVEPTAEASTSKGTKRKASGSSSGSKRKQSKPAKAGVCLLKDATPLFPFDPKGYLHTGVPPEYISKREGSKYAPNAVYACEYSKAEQAKGNKVSECDTVCQQKAQKSHVHSFIWEIICYLCNHSWWSLGVARPHHSRLFPMYGMLAGDPSERLVIKTEVTEEADD